MSGPHSPETGQPHPAEAAGAKPSAYQQAMAELEAFRATLDTEERPPAEPLGQEGSDWLNQQLEASRQHFEAEHKDLTKWSQQQHELLQQPQSPDSPDGSPGNSPELLSQRPDTLSDLSETSPEAAQTEAPDPITLARQAVEQASRASPEEDERERRHKFGAALRSGDIRQLKEVVKPENAHWFQDPELRSSGGLAVKNAVEKALIEEGRGLNDTERMLRRRVLEGFGLTSEQALDVSSAMASFNVSYDAHEATERLLAKYKLKPTEINDVMVAMGNVDPSHSSNEAAKQALAKYKLKSTDIDDIMSAVSDIRTSKTKIDPEKAKRLVEFYAKQFHNLDSLEYGEPGIVKKLHEKAGWRDYTILSISQTFRQVRNLHVPPDRTYLVSPIDHNGASRTLKRQMTAVHGERRGQHANIVVLQATTVSEAAQRIDTVVEDTGRPLEHLNIHLHADTEHGVLGNGPEGIVTEDNFTGRYGKPLLISHGALAPGAEVTVNGCEAAGFTKPLADEYNVRVMTSKDIAAGTKRRLFGLLSPGFRNTEGKIIKPVVYGPSRLGAAARRTIGRIQRRFASPSTQGPHETN